MRDQLATADEILHARAAVALSALPDTPDAVAAELLADRALGLPGDVLGLAHPLAIWLSRQLGPGSDAWLTGTDVPMLHVQGLGILPAARALVPLPRPVAEFAAAYDRGEYPDLVLLQLPAAVDDPSGAVGDTSDWLLARMVEVGPEPVVACDRDLAPEDLAELQARWHQQRSTGHITVLDEHPQPQVVVPAELPAVGRYTPRASDTATLPAVRDSGAVLVDFAVACAVAAAAAFALAAGLWPVAAGAITGWAVGRLLQRRRRRGRHRGRARHTLTPARRTAGR